MKNITKFFATALFFCTVVSPVMAGEATITDGFYGAVDGGRTKAIGACNDAPAGVAGCKDAAFLYRFAGGFQLTPMWGMEASYGNYGKASLGTYLGVPLRWRLRGYQVSGTFTLPLRDAFSLIGKLGIAETDVRLSGGGVSISATSKRLAYGIGAKYDFTKSVAARAQYERLGKVGNANTGTAKVRLFSAGIVLKF